MLYFLFITARRESLFNAFTTYLGRLGLLRRWWTAGPDEAEPTKTSLALESLAGRRRRVKSYLDRFGALYGSFSDQFIASFLASIDGGDDKSLDGTAMPAMHTGAFDWPTVLPVFGATCLMSLGWISTLPPGNDVPRTDGQDF
jgi:hypothetical protein